MSALWISSLPSVAKLNEAFPEQGRAVRNLLERMGRGWVAPRVASDTLEAIAALVGCEVEAMRDDGWHTYFCDIGALYVNVGDTYMPTLLLDTRTGSLRVISWGDFVEKRPNRFA